ncbi:MULTISPECIES: hypothetical protein [Bacillaceae]|uniref:hypothetical protein n=1 Tax=Bacillaceae TaxID=186817 RepID=UPI00118D5182|nr:hypothetical protein [Bacillus sp. S3]QCJ41196.1 hypothetical protein FAY30_04395 [Bacillus sp. S3]
MKMIKTGFLRVFAIIAILILTLGMFILVSLMQEVLFVPKDYIIWVFKSPYSGLVIIFELYLFVGFFYIFNKDLRNVWKNGAIFKKYRKLMIAAFSTFTIILLYTIITAVTVVTKDRIIDYSFFAPQGKSYSYDEIVKIQTGVYGKGRTSLFTHAKGDFFYIIEFNDGTKIDLAQVGGTKKDEDERFILEKLDIRLVNMGINKESSMKYFEYSKKGLAKIYTDKIRSILENTK